MGRLATGIAGFDTMLGGGLPEGSSVVLQGPPGQEKLVFALTFLADGLKRGGSGVFVISSQSAESILSELRRLGVDLDAVAKENRLRIVDWYSWAEETITDVEERGIIIRSSVDLSTAGAALSRAIASLPNGVSARAVVEILSPATNKYELNQVYAFAQSSRRKFERFNITALFVLEKEMHAAAVLSTLTQPFDGVIEMERTRSGDRIIRKIGVLHLKDATPDVGFLPLEMTEKGFRVIVPAREAPTAEPAPPKPMSPKPAPPKRSVPVPLLTEAETPENRQRRVHLILEIAKERLAADPTDKDAWFALAAGQATLGDVRGSLASLERLAALDERYPGLWVLKAKLHARLGQEEQWHQARMKADQYEEPTAVPAADLVPCPVCAKPIAKEASLCPHCGSRTEPELDIIEELEELTKATIQDLVEEGGPEATEPTPEAPPEPEPEVAPTPEPEPVPEPAEVSPEDVVAPLDELAELVAKAEPEAPTKKVITRKRREEGRKGLTNGLVLEQAAARRAIAMGGGRGRTNGLTNGLRGRTNGLTNGLGRTNGLTNGLGRTNGLTNGLRGRTNGLTNGLRGRTNGLTNGLGRTNGLTNGLGRTNGLKNLSGPAKSMHRFTRSPWTRYGLPIAVIALLIVPLFFLWGGPTRTYPISIDGQFGDWSGVAKVSTIAPAATPNPDIDLVRVAVKDNIDYLSFYLEVRGSATAGGPAPERVTNGFYVFLDTDRSRATGYQVQGIGADHMLRINTWGGQIVGTTLYGFDSSRGPQDWNGWTQTGSVDAAAAGSRMEFQVPWTDLGQGRGPVQASFASRSWDGESDAGDVVVTSADPYVVVSQDTRAATVLSASTPALAAFMFHAVDGDVSLTGLNVTLIGTYRPGSLSAVDLVDEGGAVLGEQPASGIVRFNLNSFTVSNGANRTLTVRAKIGAVDGTTAGAFLQGLQDVRASGGVALVAPARLPASLGYVGSIPNAPVVDGAFSDWPNVTADPLADVRPQWNPDVDLSGYAFRPSGGSTFFMARTVGAALNGTMIPASNPAYVPPSNSTGNGTVSPPNPPPPPENGTDAIRFFLDADGSASTGYSVGGIGADFLVEITGKEGLILSAQAKQFTGTNPGQWSWTGIGASPTAKDRSRIEAALPGVTITNASRAFFQTNGWGGSTDDSSLGVTPSKALAGPFLMQTLSMNQVSTLALSNLSTGTGSAGGDEYGFNVTGVGRINSASGNYESFVIGAPYASGGKGAIYIFFGYAGWAPANINAASANVSIIGQTAGDHFGWSIAAAGDVNGDGIMDFLVGAPDAGAGKAYLIYGRTSWTGITGTAINTVASVVAIVGQNSGDKFGSAVAGLGNVNGAGNADIAVGAYAYGSNKGRVYVFCDNSTMPVVASQASLFLDGTATGDKFGFSVAGAGNTNGDGYSDFVIGAPGANKAYVYTTGINPVSNGFLTANANGWSFGKVDPNGYDTGAWDNTGGGTVDSSGAGSYRFRFADTTSALTLTFHAETTTANTVTANALWLLGPDGAASGASSSVTAAANGDHLLIGTWTTPALGIGTLAAGTWTITYNGAAGAGITTGHLDVHIFKESSSGSLAAIDGTTGADNVDGVAASGNLGSQNAYVTGTYSMSATSLASTDALVIKVYGKAVIMTNGAKTITFNFDGSSVNSNIVAPVAYPETRYFHLESAAVNGLTTKQILTNSPDQATVQTTQLTITTARRYIFGNWTTQPVGITWIPAGDWVFVYWGNSKATTSNFDVHVFKRSSSGVQTAIDGTSGLDSVAGIAVSGTVAGTAGQYVVTARLGAISLATTDSIVVRVYLNVTVNSASKTANFDFDNSAEPSRFSYPGQTYTDRLYIVSGVAFTSPVGSYTNVRYRLSYNSTVSSIGDAVYRVKYQLRDGADTTTVVTAYDSGNLTATLPWGLQTGTFTGLSASTSYKVRIMVEIYNLNQGQTPSIGVNVDDIDLQFEALTSLTGSASTSFGWSVAMVATGTGLTSFNNDNYADVVVGVPGTASGQVNIYYGSTSFSSTAAVTITGASNGDQFGYSVSSVADFNGDGVADIAVGAPFHKVASANNAGAIYVFTGSSAPASSMTTTNAYNNAFGENANDHYGWSVSYSRPNGASTSMILVGAPNFSVPNSNEGKVYVLAIPEFGDVLMPIASIVLLVLAFRSLARRRRQPTS